MFKMLDATSTHGWGMILRLFLYDGDDGWRQLCCRYSWNFRPALVDTSIEDLLDCGLFLYWYLHNTIPETMRQRKAHSLLG